MSLPARIPKNTLRSLVRAALPVNRPEVKKMLSESGITYKGKGGFVTATKAKQLIHKLTKEEHLLKRHFTAPTGVRINTVGRSDKVIVRDIIKTKEVEKTAAEVRKEHLAEKEEILNDAGLKKPEHHNAKIVKALDRSWEKEQNETVASTSNSDQRSVAGLKSSSMPVSRVNVSGMGLAPTLPIKNTPSVSHEQMVPEIESKSVLEPAPLEPGDPSQAIDTPI